MEGTDEVAGPAGVSTRSTHVLAALQTAVELELSCDAPGDKHSLSDGAAVILLSTRSSATLKQDSTGRRTAGGALAPLTGVSELSVCSVLSLASFITAAAAVWHAKRVPILVLTRSDTVDSVGSEAKDADDKLEVEDE